MMILAAVHDDRLWWLPIVLFGSIAAVMPTSAFFPSWKAEWGDRHSRRTIPMSTLGRVTVGSMLACLAIMLANHNKVVGYVGFAVYLILFAVTGFACHRDYRNHEKTAGDERKEN